MGKARVWGLLLLIGAAWGDDAWAQSCVVGPVCVGSLSFDTLDDAVYYAQVAGVPRVEVMESYEPSADLDVNDEICAHLGLDGTLDVQLVALSPSVRWPGIDLIGGSLSLSGGAFAGACSLSYDERVARWDEDISDNVLVMEQVLVSAQLIASGSSLQLDDVTFDAMNALSPDSSLGALFLWDSSLVATSGTSFVGYPREGAVELVAHDADVIATLTDVTFSDNQALALKLRLTLVASIERSDAYDQPAEPSFEAALTGVTFSLNSPGYGTVADITADELKSLTLTSGEHEGTDDGIALYAINTHVTMTETHLSHYERGVNVGSEDGIITGAFDESDDVSLSITGGSFTSLHNDDDHGGAITAASGEITVSGVTASDLSSQNAPFVKAYYAPSLLVEDLTLSAFTVGAAPSAAIHAEQVDSVTLRRVAVCGGQSSQTEAGGGVALYVNGRGGPNQRVEVHNLASWGHRLGDGMFPAMVYAEQIETLWVKHSTFVGGDEPTERDAYAIQLNDPTMRTRWTVTSALVQGLTKGFWTQYGDADSSTNPDVHELDYALFTDVDLPLIAELSVDADPYDLTENVALNTAEAGFWSVFDPVDCAAPPLLGLGSYAIDRGDPREGDLDDDGSLPDIGAYSGLYADELPDADGDGYRLGLDCDDGDDEVHPGQLDAPLDGVDNDCDGQDAPGGDDTGADDSGDPDQDAPLQFDYFGGRSCGGGAVDTGGAAALLFLGTFTRRRRP